MQVYITNHAAQRYRLRAQRPPEELPDLVARVLRGREWPRMRFRGGRARVRLPGLGGIRAVVEIEADGWVVVTILPRREG